MTLNTTDQMVHQLQHVWKSDHPVLFRSERIQFFQQKKFEYFGAKRSDSGIGNSTKSWGKKFAFISIVISYYFGQKQSEEKMGATMGKNGTILDSLPSAHVSMIAANKTIPPHSLSNYH